MTAPVIAGSEDEVASLEREVEAGEDEEFEEDELEEDELEEDELGSETGTLLASVEEVPIESAVEEKEETFELPVEERALSPQEATRKTAKARKGAKWCCFMVLMMERTKALIKHSLSFCGKQNNQPSGQQQGLRLTYD